MQIQKNIRLLTWFNFFTDLRFFAPILVIYYEKITGSYTLGLSIFSVIFISAALLEIPTGILSDKIGRKMTIALGALSYTIGLTFLALANSYIFLVIGGIFEGLGRSFYSGNNNALLHDTLRQMKQEDDYHHHLGKTSSMFQISSAAASILGGIIAYYSIIATIWLSVLAQIVCLILSLFFVEPEVSSGAESSNIYSHLLTSLKIYLKNKKLMTLGVANMINEGLGNAGFEFQAAWYALIWPTWALGIARTISNVAAAIGYYFSGKVINKISAIKTLLIETIITPIVKILSVLIPINISPVIMASMSLLYGPGSVAGETLRQREFTNEQRATLGSIVSLGSSLLNSISAVLIGIIADKFGVVNAVISTQIFLFIILTTLYSKVYKSGLKQVA